MKAVLLAGGLGTRISEESHLRPKPMIEIGGRPILKRYAAHGVNDFIICLGYRGYVKSLTPWAAYIFMMCQRMGSPPISIMGLGRRCDSSEMRVPSPPASSTAFMPAA